MEMFKHMKSIIELSEEIRNYAKTHPGLEEPFKRLKESINESAYAAFIKQAKDLQSFNADDPRQDSMRQAIKAMVTLKQQAEEARQRFAAIETQKISKTTEAPKPGKLRLKDISGVELVTLTIMVLLKNNIHYIKDIENKTDFIKSLISSVKLDKGYEVDSFRTTFYKYTEDERDYPLELKHSKPKKFKKLETFLQSESGKEFERIVMEIL